MLLPFLVNNKLVFSFIFVLTFLTFWHSFVYIVLVFLGIGNNGSHVGSSNSYRTNNINNDSFSRQLIEAGMPEIPEFPFKDTSVITSLINTGILMIIFYLIYYFLF